LVLVCFSFHRRACLLGSQTTNRFSTIQGTFPNIRSCPVWDNSDSQRIDCATSGESYWTGIFTVCWRFDQLDGNLCAVVTIHASDDSHPRFGRLGGGHLLSPTSGGIQANGRGEVRNVFGSIGNYCNWSLEDCGGPEHQVAVIRAG